jgi:hypothetical protein
MSLLDRIELYNREIVKQPPAESNITVEDVPPIKIKQVYIDCIREMRGFPTGRCVPTTHKLTRLGFGTASGYFIVDTSIYPDYPFRAYFHTWAEDKDGTIIDLTATQFNPYIETPAPTIAIVKPSDPLFARYTKSPISFRGLSAHGFL